MRNTIQWWKSVNYLYCILDIPLKSLRPLFWIARLQVWIFLRSFLVSLYRCIRVFSSWLKISVKSGYFLLSTTFKITSSPVMRKKQFISATTSRRQYSPISFIRPARKAAGTSAPVISCFGDSMSNT